MYHNLVVKITRQEAQQLLRKSITLLTTLRNNESSLRRQYCPMFTATKSRDQESKSKIKFPNFDGAELALGVDSQNRGLIAVQSCS